MKLYVPPLGTTLTLATPWTFTVYRESRNDSLVELAGLKEPVRDRDWWWMVKPLGQFTFPAGTKLTVDRIYIRAGNVEYDSITFRARDYTTTVRTGLKVKKNEKTVRFWAKLDDVNGMDVV